MSFTSSPREQMIFEQLQWIERRRLRVIDHLADHLSSENIEVLIANLRPEISLSIVNLSFEQALDELDSESYLSKIAYRIQYDEARAIAHLLTTLEASQSLTDLFISASRHAGQEAARYHLRNQFSSKKNVSLSLPELYPAMDYLCFNGLRRTKIHFPSIRPLSDISIHYKSSAQLDTWRDAQVDLHFMCNYQHAWIDGLLDIFAPDIIHYRSSSINKGDSYGLDHFLPKEKFVKKFRSQKVQAYRPPSERN